MPPERPRINLGLGDQAGAKTSYLKVSLGIYFNWFFAIVKS